MKIEGVEGDSQDAGLIGFEALELDGRAPAWLKEYVGLIVERRRTCRETARTLARIGQSVGSVASWRTVELWLGMSRLILDKRHTSMTSLVRKAVTVMEVSLLDQKSAGDTRKRRSKRNIWRNDLIPMHLRKTARAFRVLCF